MSESNTLSQRPWFNSANTGTRLMNKNTMTWRPVTGGRQHCTPSTLHKVVMLRIGVARKSQGGHAPPIFSLSSDFVLWEATSHTKLLLLAWTQTFCPLHIFVPPQNKCCVGCAATDANVQDEHPSGYRPALVKSYRSTFNGNHCS